MIWVNSMGLGDCWWHVLYLIKIGGQHTLHCRQSENPWLVDLCKGTGITLRDMTAIPPDARDCWIGSSSPASWHAMHCPNDIIGFLTGTWFPWLNGGGTFSRNDMLSSGFTHHYDQACDVLVIDSLPNSGQCPEFDRVQMDNLVDELSTKHVTVAVNRRFPSLGELSWLACDAKVIVGVATGPLWPVLQHLNLSTPKYILLSPITLQFDGGTPIIHHSRVDALRDNLIRDGWL